MAHRGLLLRVHRNQEVSNPFSAGQWLALAIDMIAIWVTQAFQTPLARGNGWHLAVIATLLAGTLGFQTPLARGNGWHARPGYSD